MWLQRQYQKRQTHDTSPPSTDRSRQLLQRNRHLSLSTARHPFPIFKMAEGFQSQKQLFQAKAYAAEVVPRLDPLSARVEMINGRFDLPDATLDQMREIRAACQRCARLLKAAFDEAKDKDIGRCIAAIDALQLAKNIACDALILPFAKRE